jgi:hypothetical protein
MMTERTITITIPEMLYLQLEAAARSSAQSMDTFVARTLERTIPPHLATLLPSALRSELEAMEHLPDEALRAIAYSVAPPERGAHMDDLIELKQNGRITAEQQELLTALRHDSEALMVRKGHAFVLLRGRDHTPPRIDQLPVPSA